MTFKLILAEFMAYCVIGLFVVFVLVAIGVSISNLVDEKREKKARAKELAEYQAGLESMNQYAFTLHLRATKKETIGSDKYSLLLAEANRRKIK